MFGTLQLYGHLGDESGPELVPPVLLSGTYVAEDAVSPYVAEDGVSPYVTET